MNTHFQAVQVDKVFVIISHGGDSFGTSAWDKVTAAKR